MKRLLFSLFLFLYATLSLADSVVIGVLAYDGRAQALQRWQHTADYLSAQIPEQQFEILPLTHEELEHAINKSQLDFILTNPAHYAGLEVRLGITRIATFLSRSRDIPLKQFSSVFFTRPDQVITQYEELRGLRLAAVSPEAFGGFQLMQDAAMQHGFDISSNMDVIWMGFPHSDVVEAVLSGRADVGTVRSGTLEKMAARGDIDLSQLYVLFSRKTPGFPLLHSVDLYPEWPIATLPDTDNLLAKKVTMALLSMPQEHEAAIASRGAGWTIPLNYAAVHDVLRRLEINPYQPVPLSPAKFFQTYSHWIIIIILLLLAGAYSLFRYFVANRKMLHAQNELQKHQEELENIVQLRTTELLEVNQALQEEISYHVKTEKTLDTSCDVLQSIYSIFIRDDLGREQRLISVVDSVRRFLNTEFALLSCAQDEAFNIFCIRPTGSELSAPLSEPRAEEAFRHRQIIVQPDNDTWPQYIACPILIEGELQCLLEFASSREFINATDQDVKTTPELGLKILNLIAQWLGYEIVLHNREQESLGRHQQIRQRFADISPRERDVLQLLVQGEPTKSIARSLNLSTKTVEMHRSSLIRKTGAKSSTEIVQLAVLANIFDQTQ